MHFVVLFKKSDEKNREKKTSAIPLKTSLWWIVRERECMSRRLKQRKQTRRCNDIIGAEQTNQFKRWYIECAENGENACVNDPIPLGHIQFNSTTLLDLFRLQRSFSLSLALSHFDLLSYQLPLPVFRSFLVFI